MYILQEHVVTKTSAFLWNTTATRTHDPEIVKPCHLPSRSQTASCRIYFGHFPLALWKVQEQCTK